MFDTAGMKILIVGGGKIAKRKAGKLAGTEAEVSVVSTSFTEEIKTLSASYSFNLEKRKFQPEDISGVDLVFVACGESGGKQKF